MNRAQAIYARTLPTSRMVGRRPQNGLQPRPQILPLPSLSDGWWRMTPSLRPPVKQQISTAAGRITFCFSQFSGIGVEER